MVVGDCYATQTLWNTSNISTDLTFCNTLSEVMFDFKAVVSSTNTRRSHFLQVVVNAITILILEDKSNIYHRFHFLEHLLVSGSKKS